MPTPKNNRQTVKKRNIKDEVVEEAKVLSSNWEKYRKDKSRENKLEINISMVKINSLIKELANEDGSKQSTKVDGLS